MPPMTRRPTALGALLRSRRKARKVGFKQLAAATGLEPETLRKWEVGEIAEPPLRGVLLYAREVGITLKELEAVILPSVESSDPRAPTPPRDDSADRASVRAAKRAAGKRQPRRSPAGLQTACPRRVGSAQSAEPVIEQLVLATELATIKRPRVNAADVHDDRQVVDRRRLDVPRVLRGVRAVHPITETRLARLLARPTTPRRLRLPLLFPRLGRRDGHRPVAVDQALGHLGSTSG